MGLNRVWPCYIDIWGTEMGRYTKILHSYLLAKSSRKISLGINLHMYSLNLQREMEMGSELTHAPYIVNNLKTKTSVYNRINNIHNIYLGKQVCITHIS